MILHHVICIICRDMFVTVVYESVISTVILRPNQTGTYWTISVGFSMAARSTDRFEQPAMHFDNISRSRRVDFTKRLGAESINILSNESKRCFGCDGFQSFRDG